MSSRNRRLNIEQRNAAPFIYQVLSDCKAKFSHEGPETIKSYVKNAFDRQHDLRLEYFEITDYQLLKQKIFLSLIKNTGHSLPFLPDQSD